MNEQVMANMLQQCVERLQAGESVEAILRDFPEDAARLAPLLQAVAVLRRQEPERMPEAARTAALQRMRAAFAGQSPPPRSSWITTIWGAGQRTAFRLALMLLFVVTLGAGVARAQSSLPGDTLYPVKRASEQVRLQLARSPASRAALFLDLAARRVDEAVRLQAEGRPPDAASLRELAQDYDLALAALAQVAPAERPALQARFASTVSAHQQTLARAAATASAPQLRQVLLEAARVSAATATRLGAPAIEPLVPEGATPAPPQQTVTPGPGSPEPALQATPSEVPAPAATSGSNVRATPTTRPRRTAPPETSAPATTRPEAQSTPTTTPRRPSPTGTPTTRALGANAGEATTAARATTSAGPTLSAPSETPVTGETSTP